MADKSCQEYTVLFDSKEYLLSSPPERWQSTTVGLPMEFVQAELSHDHDRKIIPDYEQKIEELWKARLQEKNLNLYNGSKFRLQDATVTDKGVLFKFGITCYMDFQCTNMQPSSFKLLREYALQNFNDPNACMANAMFVQAVVVSKDDCVVLFKRSNMVGESPGMIDVPGGHMEPNEVDKNESLDNMAPNDVVYELYYSAVREVRDEVNIPESFLSWPTLLGIIRNNTIGGKPGACFYMKCECSSDEIKNHYKKGGPESFESTEVFLIHVKELFEEKSPKFEELSKNLAISAKALLNLYKPYYKPDGN